MLFIAGIVGSCKKEFLEREIWCRSYSEAITNVDDMEAALMAPMQYCEVQPSLEE